MRSQDTDSATTIWVGAIKLCHTDVRNSCNQSNVDSSCIGNRADRYCPVIGVFSPQQFQAPEGKNEVQPCLAIKLYFLAKARTKDTWHDLGPSIFEACLYSTLRPRFVKTEQLLFWYKARQHKDKDTIWIRLPATPITYCVSSPTQPVNEWILCL